MNYDWPGNVRELENTIERLVIMSTSDIIAPSDLPDSVSIRRLKVLNKSVSLISNIEEIEKTNIRDALEKTGRVQAKAAKLLGITPRQIGYKIKKYGLEEKS
jgi:Nif-specific regulatory protein